MNSWARLIAAGTLMIVLAGCSQAASSTAAPTAAPTVTVTVTPTSPATSSTAAPASDVGVCITPVVTCHGELRSEPSQIILSGDGTAFVTGLVWTGWGLSGATGSGTLKLDNCNPNCAQGSLTSYQATIVLSKLTPYTGGAAYDEMMVDAAGSPFGTKTYQHLAP